MIRMPRGIEDLTLHKVYLIQQFAKYFIFGRSQNLSSMQTVAVNVLHSMKLFHKLVIGIVFSLARGSKDFDNCKLIIEIIGIMNLTT